MKSRTFATSNTNNQRIHASHITQNLEIIRNAWNRHDSYLHRNSRVRNEILPQ